MVLTSLNNLCMKLKYHYSHVSLSQLVRCDLLPLPDSEGWKLWRVTRGLNTTHKQCVVNYISGAQDIALFWHQLLGTIT